MKKLIYSTLALTLTGSFAFAQKAPIHQTGPRFKSENSDVQTVKRTTSLGKATVSGWYEPVELGGTGGASTFMQSFVQFVLPDSIPKYIDEADTIFRPQDISFGQVIDPKDDKIDLTANPGLKLSKFANYSLDSLYFAYLYVRYQNVTDTLYVKYFRTAQPQGIRKGTLNGTPSEVYAVPVWDRNTMTSQNYIHVDTILLTDADSTLVIDNNGGFENSWRVKIKELAPSVPINVTGTNTIDNLIGFTVHFKPGHAYDSNSVYVYQKDETQFPLPPTNPRMNYFGFRFYSNEGTDDQQNRQLKFYTNSGRCTKQSAYEPTGTTAWDGYIPGNAFFDHIYVQCGMKLTATNVGTKDIKNNEFAMTEVYPNPATTGTTATWGFNLKNDSKVEFTVTNLFGQQVKTFSRAYSAGQQAEEISLENMKPGVYFFSMTVNGTTETKKLTITE